MAVNAKTAEGGGKRQDPLDAATYPAIIAQAVYYGVQKQRPFKGEDKDPRPEMGYTYQLLDEYCVDDDGNEDEDKPRWISETFPVYNMESERAKSTIRIKALDPNDDWDGDFMGGAGIFCNVTLTKTEGKGGNAGKWYNNVSNVSQMREKELKRYKKYKSPNEVIAFDVDEPNSEIFQKLNRWVQTKLKENLGYEGSELQEIVANLPKDDEKKEKGKKGKKGKKNKKDKKEKW